MENIENILKFGKVRKLMVVFPHPDDESFATAGLLLYAKRLGIKTYVVTLTKGGAGKMHIHPKGRSIKEVRTDELMHAVKFLKADRLILADFDDAKLREQKIKWRSWLLRKIEKINPDLLVTYDHSGLSGHPDHIVLSLELKKIIAKLNRSVNFNIELYWACMPKEIRDRLIKKFVDPKVYEFETEPTHLLDIRGNISRKYLALKSHRSQKTIPFIVMLYLLFFWHAEWYHKVDLKKRYHYKFGEFKI